MGFMTTSFKDEKPIKYFTYEAGGFGWADTTANGIFGYLLIFTYKIGKENKNNLPQGCAE
jgi:hypothetical protein